MVRLVGVGVRGNVGELGWVANLFAWGHLLPSIL